jgi:lysophospholipid acyltransferase 5
MIGFAMDYWDGESPPKPGRKTDALIADEELALSHVPSLLETLGYAYFFGGFLVGPQFPFERYRRWITGDLFLVREEDVNAQAAYHASMPRHAVSGKALRRDGTTLELPKLREKGTYYVPSSALYAIRCLVIGLGVLISTQVLRTWFYAERTIEPEFATLGFVKKILLYWMCGKVALEKVRLAQILML